MPHHQPPEWDLGLDLVNCHVMLSLENDELYAQEEGHFVQSESTCNNFGWNCYSELSLDPKILSTAADPATICSLPTIGTCSEILNESFNTIESPPISPKSAFSPAPLDVVSKRRRQNRQAQIAFRQRNKRLVEDLKSQLKHSAKLNQTLGTAVYTALAMLPSINFAVEQVLRNRRDISGDFLRGEISRLDKCLGVCVEIMTPSS